MKRRKNGRVGKRRVRTERKGRMRGMVTTTLMSRMKKEKNRSARNGKTETVGVCVGKRGVEFSSLIYLLFSIYLSFVDRLLIYYLLCVCT